MNTADKELLSGFADGTLTRFPHSDHLRVAYLNIATHGLDGAVNVMCAGIRTIAEANGAPMKFHMTRTVAWLRLVEAAMGRGNYSSSTEFLDQHSFLLRRDLLDDYYLPTTLQSDAARAAFVEPDVKAFV